MRDRKDSGYTVIELIVTVGLAALLMGGAIISMQSLRQPADEGASEVVSFLKLVRARALISVRAYRVAPISTTRLAASYASSCSAATFTTDSSLALKLPNHSSLAATNWSICYTSRGIAESNLSFVVRDSEKSRTIQIALGGGVQVQ